MTHSDERAFVPLTIALLTVSDSRSLDTDRSGDVLQEKLTQAGHRLGARALVPDDRDAIVDQVRPWIADAEIPVVLITGGTGITGRDITPEALDHLIDKPIPGFGELFLMISYSIIGSSTFHSRACAGVAGSTLIFALPGSPSACRDAWDHILKDQLDIRHKPCNFAELLPRLGEQAAP